MRIRTGIGQDSHRFLPDGSTKLCVIGGLIFDGVPGLAADSDGDVVLHAICNAITSVTGVPILGGIAIDLCHKDGITDSKVYLERAVATLGEQRIEHVALSLEAKRPRLEARLLEMRKNVAAILQIDVDQVGITATSGDGLTDFGLGEGLQCLCILTSRHQ
jgi:2-C-methyl-D-erythritol 2,4-cyclodiphosphate synthase